MRPSLGRLTKRSEFLRVARTRQKWVAPGLILQAYGRSCDRKAEPTEADTLIRVGFTASRKVGKAVERNRARRRLKAVVAEVLPQGGRPGHDYVVIARQATLRRPYRALVADLRTALERVSGRHGGGAPGRRGDAARSEPRT